MSELPLYADYPKYKGQVLPCGDFSLHINTILKSDPDKGRPSAFAYFRHDKYDDSRHQKFRKYYPNARPPEMDAFLFGGPPKWQADEWKIHISIKPPSEAGPEAIDTIAKAWEIVKETAIKYDLRSCKVITPDNISFTSAPKTITLYYGSADPVPMWNDLLNEIEQKFIEQGIPGGGCPQGDFPIKNSRYFYASRGKQATTPWQGERVEPTARTEDFLKGGPFENIEIVHSPTVSLT